MEKINIKFAENKSHVLIKLRRDVYGYLKANNISIHANKKMHLKTAFFLLVFAASYIAIVFMPTTGWMKILLCVAAGLVIPAIGFNISHDSSHNAYFKSKRWNKIFSYSMDLVGSNSYMWDIKHNKSHHIYTNIDEFDEDIKGSYLLRLSPHSPFHRINRLQYVYAWLLYCFIYFYIVWVYNFVQFASTRFGPFQKIKHPRHEWIKLFVWKLFYVTYAIVIPAWYMELSLLQFFIGYGTVCVTAGFVLGITFYLAHAVEKAYHFPLASTGTIENDWVTHQLESTANFAMTNPVITWYTGGLNYQIEHHLFPEICSIHYARISSVIRKTLQQYDLPYHYYDTVQSAVVSHYKVLKKFSEHKN